MPASSSTVCPSAPPTGRSTPTGARWSWTRNTSTRTSIWVGCCTTPASTPPRSVTTGARWSTTRRQRLTEFDRALAERDRADINIIKAQIDQAEAQIALLDEQMARVKLTAPFDGIVVSGDLSQSVGASVSRGEELFQIAPLDAYRVILEVDEGDISNLAVGQRGSLLLSSIPEEPLAFSVDRITPVAEAREGRNYFRVEARLDEVSERLRPGMEGIAKTRVEERLLIWIWTRKFVDWLRLTLWTWVP